MTVNIIESKSTITIEDEKSTIEITPVVQNVEVSFLGAQGLKGDIGPAGPAGPAGANGQDGADGNTNVFIQPDAPTGVTGSYLWINTTGGNLQFLVEDGL